MVKLHIRKWFAIKKNQVLFGKFSQKSMKTFPLQTLSQITKGSDPKCPLCLYLKLNFLQKTFFKSDFSLLHIIQLAAITC